MPCMDEAKVHHSCLLEFLWMILWLQEIHKLKSLSLRERCIAYSRWVISDYLGYYLGVEVSQKLDGININQSAYARKIMESSGWVTVISAQYLWKPVWSWRRKVEVQQHRRRYKISEHCWQPLLPHTFPTKYLLCSRICKLVYGVSHEEHIAAMKHILQCLSFLQTESS